MDVDASLLLSGFLGLGAASARTPGFVIVTVRARPTCVQADSAELFQEISGGILWSEEVWVFEGKKYNNCTKVVRLREVRDFKNARIHSVDIIRQFMVGHRRRKNKHDMEHMEHQESKNQKEYKKKESKKKSSRYPSTSLSRG